MLFRKIIRRPYRLKVVVCYDTIFGSVFTLYRIGRYYWRGSDILPNVIYYFGKYKDVNIAIKAFEDFLYPMIID